MPPLVTTQDTEPAAAVAAAAEAVVPARSRGERLLSFDPADFAAPTGREEEWRFTPVDRLQPMLRDEPAGGRLDWSADLPEGVTLQPATLAQVRELGITPAGDRAAALAMARSQATSLLSIPASVEPDRPIRVAARGASSQKVARAHLVISAGRHTRATVLLEHRGQAQYCEAVSVLTGDGADLTVVSLQEWDDAAVHLSEQNVVVGRDARVRHIAVSLGGSLVRVATNVRYTGPGGSFEGFGVYFADAGQHLEHRLFVDHEAPRCASHVTYKGALQGQTAHTVWVGDVLIRAAAEGTDSYELNRNLLLTDGARADSVPNLEIETGEIVGAGHASATGRFDDEQLFYMQSRGISAEEARRLVVRGFFSDIVTRIGVPEVTERVMAAIDAELTASLGAPSGASAEPGAVP
ncbi:MAG TPA: Fe-S cluster assembly protein SufD [Dermatophilaceae bacterium]|nr:Fe-S cluster assembly protein SufD [Dermatophilaceae bacterium]